jgi:hypothetical protein
VDFLTSLPENRSIFIAVPNLGNMNSRLSMYLVRLARISNIEIRSFENYQPLDFARNTIREEFLESDFDVLLTIDADVVPPENLLDLITLDLDVVGPVVYIWKNGQVIPLALRKTKKGWQVIGSLSSGNLMKCDAIAIGCCMISRKVLETVPVFRYVYDSNGKLVTDEGFHWFDQVQEAGFDVYLHTGYECDHFKTINLRDIVKLQNLARLKSEVQ